MVSRLTAASDMLRQLRQCHAEVRACFEEMETLTSQPLPDRLAYTTARFRISRASMARRTCFNSVCAELSKNASQQEAAVIQQVKDVDRALMGKSADHVMKWTTDAVAADWLGYRNASRKIRGHMAAELQAEENLLFPLLERRSRQALRDRRGSRGA